MKKEQYHVARSLPKRPSGPKHIFCHYCGAFGHLRPQYSKFHAFKRIKSEEKLEFFGNCAKKSKPVLSENNIFLKKMFVRLNLINNVLALFHDKFACNIALRNLVFRWESCKGSV